MDFSHHIHTDYEALVDGYELVCALNKLPQRIVINLSEPLRKLYSDKILSNFISEELIIHCLDNTLQGINEQYDCLDYAFCAIEAQVDIALTKCSEQGNLPPSELTLDGNDSLAIALTEQLFRFCIQVTNIIKTTSVPVYEYIGMPYSAERIKPSSGAVIFKLKDPEEMRVLVFG